MSSIVDNRAVIKLVNQLTTTGIVLDLSDIDILSLSATYVPVGGGTGTLALYESVDGVNYVAVSGLTVSITASGTTIWHLDPVFSKYYKILYTATSFGMTFTVTMNARNNTALSNAYVVPTPVVVNS
jgi:hypothetical protein